MIVEKCVAAEPHQGALQYIIPPYLHSFIIFSHFTTLIYL